MPGAGGTRSTVVPAMCCEMLHVSVCSRSGHPFVMMSEQRALRSVIVVFVTLVSMMARSAHAQSPTERADAQFRRGKDLLAAGKVAEACAAFDDSQALEANPATVLNQANCREHNGQLATARALYVEAARQTSAATDKASRHMHANAAERAAKLAPRVSTLRIAVPAAAQTAGLEVRRDGELVDPASWNQPVAIDGGAHGVSARAPGRVPWSGTVVVATERASETIEIPVLRPPATDAPAAVPAAPVVSATPPVVTPRARWTTRRKVALGVAAGGAAALGAAGVLGVSALQRQSDARALCPDIAQPCDDAARATALSRSAHDRAVFANIGFGIAAGAAATAVVLWLTGAPESPRGLALAPALSPGQLVVTATRSW
jgi:hypothetical protein